MESVNKEIYTLGRCETFRKYPSVFCEFYDYTNLFILPCCFKNLFSGSETFQQRMSSSDLRDRMDGLEWERENVGKMESIYPGSAFLPYRPPGSQLNTTVRLVVINNHSSSHKYRSKQELRSTFLDKKCGNRGLEFKEPSQLFLSHIDMAWEG